LQNETRMREVSLHCHPTVTRINLRELAGKDEQAVQSTATTDALCLIGGLLIEDVDPMSLAAADRDRILAAIYLAVFGSRVASTVHCARCGSLFDLNFRLDELIEALDRNTCSATVGVFTAATGFRFRLPTAAEEIDAARHPEESAEQWLAGQCVVEGAAMPTLVDVEQAMEDAAPTIDLELDAGCPECGTHQAVRFDVQSFLLTAIMQGSPRLGRDVHRIASAYHWTRQEILGMPRSERRELANLIEAETVTHRRLSR
jgi:hypothetical protein